MAYLITSATVRSLGDRFADHAMLACTYEGAEIGEMCPNDIPEGADFELVGIGSGSVRIWCMEHSNRRAD